MKDSGFSVEGLFIDYKHKSRQNERQSASYMANQLDCLLHITAVPLDQQFFIDARPFDPPLTQSDVRQQQAGLDIMLCISHWLLIASVYCYYLNIPYIALGVTASDAQRLPKVGWKFVDKISEIMHDWSGKGPQILLPLLSKNKQEVVSIGRDLGVPYDKTWSCLEQGDVHCGGCAGCKMRRDALPEAGIIDVMQYGQT